MDRERIESMCEQILNRLLIPLHQSLQPIQKLNRILEDVIIALSASKSPIERRAQSNGDNSLSPRRWKIRNEAKTIMAKQSAECEKLDHHDQVSPHEDESTDDEGNIPWNWRRSKISPTITHQQRDRNRQNITGQKRAEPLETPETTTTIINKRIYPPKMIKATKNKSQGT